MNQLQLAPGREGGGERRRGGGEREGGREGGGGEKDGGREGGGERGRAWREGGGERGRGGEREGVERRRGGEKEGGDREGGGEKGIMSVIRWLAMQEVCRRFEFARYFESHLARPPPFYMHMRTTSDEHSIVTMLRRTRIIFSTYLFKATIP